MPDAYASLFGDIAAIEPADVPRRPSRRDRRRGIANALALTRTAGGRNAVENIFRAFDGTSILHGDLTITLPSDPVPDIDGHLNLTWADDVQVSARGKGCIRFRKLTLNQYLHPAVAALRAAVFDNAVILPGGVAVEFPGLTIPAVAPMFSPLATFGALKSNGCQQIALTWDQPLRVRLPQLPCTISVPKIDLYRKIGSQPAYALVHTAIGEGGGGLFGWMRQQCPDLIVEFSRA
jgi:hypothetical protein